MVGVKGLKDAWSLGVLDVEYERLKKTNSTRSIVLVRIEDRDWYTVELKEMTNEGIRRKYYWTNKNSS